MHASERSGAHSRKGANKERIDRCSIEISFTSIKSPEHDK